jgi:hypothetical protein
LFNASRNQTQTLQPDTPNPPNKTNSIFYYNERHETSLSRKIGNRKNEANYVSRSYLCPLFVWKTGKLLAHIHQALTGKWEVRMHPTSDEMFELQISPGENIESLTLNLNVVTGKALWGYIDLPVLTSQEAILQEITEVLKKDTGATIGPAKRRVKFKYEGETVETETTTANVYSWSMNYGLRYSLDQILRFTTALDSSIRNQGGRALEGNEFFVLYRDGNLHLQDTTLSFVLVTPWGYYSAFLYLGSEILELHIVDEEDKDFPEKEFDEVVKSAVELFESDKEITLSISE